MRTASVATSERDATSDRDATASEMRRRSRGIAVRICEQVSVSKISAGLLMYRKASGGTEVLLAHPGGPFWKNKDDGAWTIPKGEANPGEPLLAAAEREFREETGSVPTGQYAELIPVKLKSGKIIHAWAFEGELDPAEIHSNSFSMEWPPNSGKQVEFPEVDRVAFFDLRTARQKINAGQTPLLDELKAILDRAEA